MQVLVFNLSSILRTCDIIYVSPYLKRLSEGKLSLLIFKKENKNMDDLRGKIIKELDEFNIDADDEFLDYGV
ncbi:hypothetical protein, partial [Clostridioides difficile]|uniref:hypothetical protein n=1 Tax=Clostridioides difficile TaxID=1496 RepID=UPI00131DB993